MEENNKLIKESQGEVVIDIFQLLKTIWNSRFTLIFFTIFGLVFGVIGSMVYIIRTLNRLNP